MSIIKAYTTPHPPMIISEIGRGSEEDIRLTINAYEKIADEISSLSPETIVISSPHAPMYLDYFYISSSETSNGDFTKFGAPNIKFNEEIDTELVNAICDIAKKIDFPAGRIRHDVDLDHGTLVPLYFVRKKLPKCKIVVIGLSSLPLVDNYKMGTIIKEAINKLNRKVVYIASGDLSHKLQEYGPYGFAKEGPEYDKKIMDILSTASFDKLLEFDESFLEKASECGHRSFTIMAGALDSINVESKYFSYEDITGVGYGICSFNPKDENLKRSFLNIYIDNLNKKLQIDKSNSDEYVKLARLTIEEYITNNKIINTPKYITNDLLNNRAGVFVSIHKFGLLRGCIGTILPTKENIAQEIIANAISASTEDQRFVPITKKELNWLEINVDVMGNIEETKKEDLDVKKYGVIVSSGFKRGLLLPNIDGVDDVDTQIEIARKKGNIKENEPYKLERFEVVRHK